MSESLDQSEKRSETRSVFNLYASGMSDKDSSKKYLSDKSFVILLY